MPKTAIVQARIEPELKAKAEAILASVGLNTTTAITMFYTQMVNRREFPLEIKVPNAETLSAIAELRDPKLREELKTHASVADLMADLEA